MQTLGDVTRTLAGPTGHCPVVRELTQLAAKDTDSPEDLERVEELGRAALDADPATTSRRAYRCADWAIREVVPVVFESAALPDWAERFRALAPVKSAAAAAVADALGDSASRYHGERAQPESFAPLLSNPELAAQRMLRARAGGAACAAARACLYAMRSERDYWASAEADSGRVASARLETAIEYAGRAAQDAGLCASLSYGACALVPAHRGAEWREVLELLDELATDAPTTAGKRRRPPRRVLAGTDART